MISSIFGTSSPVVASTTVELLLDPEGVARTAILELYGHRVPPPSSGSKRIPSRHQTHSQRGANMVSDLRASKRLHAFVSAWSPKS